MTVETHSSHCQHSLYSSIKTPEELEAVPTTSSELPPLLHDPTETDAKSVLSGIGGPNTVVTCNSPIMFSLYGSSNTIPSLTPIAGLAQYSYGPPLLSSIGSFCPYTYGTTTNGLSVTTSGSEFNPPTSPTQRNQVPATPSYPYMYQPLTSTSLAYSYQQSNDSNSLSSGNNMKNQGLLPMFGHFPLSNISFPSQASFTGQGFSPFLSPLPYMAPRGPNAATDSNSITNNNYLYGQYSYGSKQPPTMVPAGGITQIFPPSGTTLGSNTATALMMPNLNTAPPSYRADAFSRAGIQMDNGRRDSVPSLTSQDGGSVPTTPIGDKFPGELS